VPSPAAETAPVETQESSRITRYQWLVLLVAWLGWVFDSMDSTIYALVLDPALRELLAQGGAPPSPGEIGFHGGIIFSIFLVGWAVGGVAFGILADRLGRTRVLIVTILIYAAFTGLAAASHTWWQLAIFRFVTALGIGGEWAAGASLVVEVWPEKKRAWAAGLLQSAWAVGFFIAALVNLALKDHGWRTVFLVGIVPALVAVVVRFAVKEPERWVKARQEGAVAAGAWRGLAELFAPALRRDTLVGASLAFVAVFGLWGVTNWVPTLVRALPDLQGRSPSELSAWTSYATMALNAGSFVGYLSFGPLADVFGRRAIFALMCLGSLAMVPTTFLTHYPAALRIPTRSSSGSPSRATGRAASTRSSSLSP
jgi:MFS family permease